MSLLSGQQIAQALKQAGHEVWLRDCLPNDLTALDEFETWGGHLIFPILHGSWGEGGPLQQILDERELTYVGCTHDAASLCMDKYRTKRMLQQHGLPTPVFERISRHQQPTLPTPLVLKAIDEGSSFDLHICTDQDMLESALTDLHSRHEHLLAEQYIAGPELTVSILDEVALPVIQIAPATDFYDYEAKYQRDDTQYLVGPEQIDLPPALLQHIQSLARQAHQALGCRHLSRVDFMVDAQQQPYILEVNTLPGFTSHSLLPMAAAARGMDLPTLTDRLVRLALQLPHS